MPRIIFIHGNGAMSWKFAWSSWLKKELEAKSFPTDFQTFPDSIIARAKYWLPFLEEHIKAGENDVIVGWSSGADAAMRYAETHKLLGSVLVAPCATDLNDPLEKMSGYFDTPWDWESIKNNQKHIALIHSDNDPFIPLEEFVSIEKNLAPKVENIVLPGKKHFIEQKEFPEVLEYILRVYNR